MTITPVKVGSEVDPAGKAQPGYTVCAPYLDLFKAFENEGILWCSWKSNEHLEDGLSGKTDIDILFNSEDVGIVRRIMHENGFIEFRAPSYRSYPGILDFIAIDPDSGQILHAHSHFLLTLGEKFLKSFVFPWNDAILTDRTLIDSTHLVYGSSPAQEIVLLLVREALKLNVFPFRQTQKIAHGSGFYRELEWLKERVSAEEATSQAEMLLDEVTGQIISEMISDKVTFQRLSQLRTGILNLSAARQWRRMSGTLAVLQQYWRKGMSFFIRVLEKGGIAQDRIVRRRILAGEGLVVALLGPDGAGKSTLTEKFVSDYSHKIDIVSLYFGTGDGHQTLPLRILKLAFNAKGVLRRFLRGQEKTGRTDLNQDGVPQSVSFSTILTAIAGVWHKRKIVRRVSSLRARGFIVVCDRWPQNLTSRMNDGPLLSDLKSDGNALLRYLGRWEERQFTKICSALLPDIAIFMMPSLETAVARKPENEAMQSIISQKIEAFGRMKFPEQVKIIRINANCSFEKVAKDARKAIWYHLRARSLTPPDFYECVGLPGAGKTTICKLVYEGKKFKSVDDIFAVNENRRMVSNLIAFTRSLFADPLLYVMLFGLVLTAEVRTNKEAISYLLKLPVQKLKLERATSNQHYLLEQMFLQNIWSALLSAGIKNLSPARLAPVISRLYHGLNPIIIYFLISPEEAANRVSHRQDGKSRFDGQPEPETRERFETFNNVMQDILTASTYAGLEVITLDAHKPIESLMKERITPLTEGEE